MTAEPEPARRVPDLLVEKLYLGELPPADAAAVHARLAASGELHRLEALARASAEGLPAGLTTRMRAACAEERRAQERRARTWSLVVSAASVAVVALVVALAVPHEALVPERGERMKGGAGLVIYRQTADARGYEALGEDARLHPGDVVQLAVRPGRARHARGARDRGAGTTMAAVYSIDGRGVVTTHLAPTALPTSQETRLPTGFVLDDAPGYERFFLVLGGELDALALSLALERVARADPERGRLDVPADAEVFVRLLRKAR